MRQARFRDVYHDYYSAFEAMSQFRKARNVDGEMRRRMDDLLARSGAAQVVSGGVHSSYCARYQERQFEVRFNSAWWTGRWPSKTRLTRSFWAKLRVWFPNFLRHILCDGHEGGGFRDACKHCGMTGDAITDRAWKFPTRRSYVIAR